MKKGFLITMVLAGFWCQLIAQTNQAPGISKDNPFADIGIDEPVLGIDGFKEMSTDSLVVIAGWVYNKRTSTLVDKVPPEPNDTLAQLFGNQLLYRWLSVDPVVHPYQSPYNSFDNNPVLYVDPDGRDIEFSIRSEHAQKKLVNIINEGLEGQFVAKLEKTDSKDVYKLVLVQTDCGSLNAMTNEGKAFYRHLDEVISEEFVTKIEVVRNDIDTKVGNYLYEKIDIDDIEQFNKGGNTVDRTKPIGATRQGKLIHEVKEQYYKQKNGLGYYDFTEAHEYGIEAENDVNGNRRGEPFETTPGSPQILPYYEKDGSVSIVRVKHSKLNGTAKVEQPKPTGLPQE